MEPQVCNAKPVELCRTLSPLVSDMKQDRGNIGNLQIKSHVVIGGAVQL